MHTALVRRAYGYRGMLPSLSALLLMCGTGMASDFKTIPGITCQTPPLRPCTGHCDQASPTDRGNAYEPRSGRAFFLDYPCDLKVGEKVVFILNLHGAGATGNWQRHYFPVADYKERYRLVIATPTAAKVGYFEPFPVGLRVWREEDDDRYLEDVVKFVFEQIGRKNIKSFWMAGHSQGGMTANRIVCSNFFEHKVDGWLSLSGGRIGAVVPSKDFRSPVSMSSAAADPDFGDAVTPACNLSFIFVAGELEIVALPEESPWAEKYQCRKRVELRDVSDNSQGYVVSEPSASGGISALAPPYEAKVFVFPKCKRGKLVADVLRLKRDHGDGLGPRVTEAIIELMMSAPGGKARETKWFGSGGAN